MEGAVDVSAMISSGITDLVGQATGILGEAGPILITTAGAFIAFNVGFKLFKRFGNKVG